MRATVRRWALLLLAFGLPGCDVADLSDLSLTPEPATATSCAGSTDDRWSIVGTPDEGIEVGSSVEIRILHNGFPFGCEAFISAVQWDSTVPGVVRFERGSASHRAIVTGATPGETTISAEVTVGDRVKTTRGEPVAVVPASEDAG